MSYEVLLFDLDHTLVDSDQSEALAFAATMQSVGIDDAVAVFPTYNTINKALWARVEAGELSPNQVKVQRFEELTVALALGANPNAMAETFASGLSEFGELYPGAWDLLAAVAETHTLGMVTNGISAIQRRRIERLEIGQFFSAVAVSAELGVSKPDPAIFAPVMEQLGRHHTNGMLMIGDSLTSDVAGGVNFGIDTCWYNPHGKPSPTSPVIPTHEITTLTQIPFL